MNRSESVLEIVKALSAAQGSIQAAPKDSVNPFKGYSYADLASVWGVIRSPLSANGLSVTQATDWRDSGLWLVSTLWHTSGEWISTDYPVFAVYEDAQKLGAAMTYARRYSLMALVGVAPESGEDLDAQEPQAGKGRDRERDRARDDVRKAVNGMYGHGRGGGTAAPPKKKPIGELIDAKLAELVARFQAEHPGATTELPNAHIVARHLYRVAGEAKPPLLEVKPGLKSGEVFRTLNKLGQDAACRAFLVDELKRYLPAKLAEARRRAAAEAAEDPEEVDDPDVDYPDEPGMNG